MLHGYAGSTGRKLRLREGIDLCTGEPVAAPWISIRSDIKPVRVRTNMRIVAEIWARVGAAGVCSVICNVNSVDVPAKRRVRSLAYGCIEVVYGRERTVGECIECQHHDEPALRLCVIQATGVSNKLPTHPCTAVDRRRISKERVQVHGMVHVARETTDDVCSGVVRQH